MGRKAEGDLGYKGEPPLEELRSYSMTHEHIDIFFHFRSTQDIGGSCLAKVWLSQWPGTPPLSTYVPPSCTSCHGNVMHKILLLKQVYPPHITFPVIFFLSTLIVWTDYPPVLFSSLISLVYFAFSCLCNLAFNSFISCIRHVTL